MTEMSIDESNAELNEESEEDEFAASLEQQQTNAMAITNGISRFNDPEPVLKIEDFFVKPEKTRSSSLKSRRAWYSAP